MANGTATVDRSIPKAIIPKQQLTKIMDAHDTATSLGRELASKEGNEKRYRLASITEVMNREVLAKESELERLEFLKLSKIGLLAASSKGLADKTEGWHQIVNEHRKIDIKPITNSQAEDLLNIRDICYDVFYVTQSSIDAAKDGNRPVIIVTHMSYPTTSYHNIEQRYLYGCPSGMDVRVALAECEPDELLRQAEARPGSG